MELLFEQKWELFVASEILTWLAVIFLLICRYQYGYIKISEFFLKLVILFSLFQAALAGIDYYYTGNLSFFQVVIILFIVYGATIGKNDFKRLDKYIQQKINKRPDSYRGDIYAYIKRRKGYFYLHSAVMLLSYFLFVPINPIVATIFYLWFIIYLFDFSIFLFYSFWLYKNKQYD